MDAVTEPAVRTSPGDARAYRMTLPGLSLTQDVSHGPLDGAWWPRCDAPQPTDLAAETHAITLDWELLVVPPDEPAAGVATLPLTAAADPENPLPAPRMLAFAEEDLAGEATGEAEGGHGLR
ncbi:hypothetical protein ACGFZB_07990 [Streptomyces cinerochromogenes]|uniref:Uncharacterized protein n=1 Tax=Streptomyces cinerochromogenes TaxID=66422 RepID=A0ABW7B2S5_9ACTN